MNDMTALNDPTLGINPLLAAEWSQRLGTETRLASNQTSVRLNPGTWIAYPETAQAVGCDLPDRISRADLSSMAGHVDWINPSAPALKSLFVHTMAWGSGTTNGRGPRYTEQALASGAVPEVMARLGRLLTPDGAAAIQHSRIAAAYALHPRLPGVGPAFFTKLLWVVGGSTACAPIPLILDARVWGGLAKLGWNSVEAAGGTRNRGKRYVAYLLACQSWAEQAACSAEDIEYTLFWRP